MSDTVENALAHLIATALYKHRYPRAMGGVADRDHPSHRRFWEEADAVLDALTSARGAFAQIVRPDNGYCNQCGGHWLYRTDGSWSYGDGEHREDCLGRALTAVTEGAIQ